MMRGKEVEGGKEVKWDMYRKKMEIEGGVLGEVVMNEVVGVGIE